MSNILIITVYATLEHGTHEKKCAATYTKNDYNFFRS